jgi:ubiquinone/menaquinone biosynthesis C-methylase UbiE
VACDRGDKMSDLGFKLMVLIYWVVDLFYSPEKRLETLKIRPGVALLDYGCGPGRYLKGFCSAVGKNGKVYAADIHELALHYSKKRMEKHGLGNVELVPVRDYHCDIADNNVDIICAFDMLHQVTEPNRLFKELHRMIKRDGTLILDDGHQKRDLTKRQIDESRLWKIIEEKKDHLKCSPK